MTTDQVPITPETMPEPKVVDFYRASLERNRRKQNERDRLREQRRQPDPPEAA